MSPRSTGAVNLIVTVLNMRAPGMTMMRMPIFTWMALVTQFLLLFAMPVITVALFLLLFQRNYGATFFSVHDGADPLLWQHLFWIFGHPEVYIIVLPAFGIVSEVLPVFSRKPLFGYPFVVFSGAAIGFLGWGVWAHHMFASGLGPISVSVFAVATMAIAIPTGVKIINWTLTMWGGKLYFSTAMLFAIGLIIEFTIGGLSGVTHSVAPSDTQQTDTYYIVAHFHYVIFGGGVLGLFAGMYYWWPKVFGKHAQREDRQVELLVHDRRHEHDVRADAHPRPAGSAPPHVHLDRAARRRGFLQPRLLEPRLLDRHRRARRPACSCSSSTSGTRPARRRPPRPIRGTPAASNGSRRARRRSTTSSASRPCTRSTSSSIASTKTSAPATSTSTRRWPTGEEVIAEEVAHADAHIHLPSPSYWPIMLALALPIMAYGVIYHTLLIVVGACAGSSVRSSGGHSNRRPLPTSDFDPPADGDEPSKELAVHV